MFMIDGKPMHATSSLILAAIGIILAQIIHSILLIFHQAYQEVLITS